MKAKLQQGWKEFELGDLIKIIAGQAPPSSSYNKNNIGLPFLRVNSFNEKYPSTDTWTTDSLKECEEGDILLSVAGTIGSINIADKKYSITRSIFALRVESEELNNLYLFYFLKTLKEKLLSFGIGSSQKIITIKTVASLRIPIPSLSVQKEIVSILEKAEKLKEMRKEADRLTKNFLKAVFFEMFGDPGKNNKKWPVVKIEDCVEYSQYGTSAKSNEKKKGYPIIGMNNVSTEGNIDLSKFNYVDIPEEEFVKLKLSKGDVLFNRTNSPALIGKTAYWDENIDAVAASYLVKLKMKNNCNFVFFTYLMNTVYFKKLFYSSCKKAVNQANISPTLLKTFSMYLPPITLQNKFAAIVKDVVEMKKHQKRSREHIENLFNDLMQKAFRGELAC